MATWARRYPDNAGSPFFVDDSCIDCGACWQIAPSVFRDAGEHSVVQRQPATPEERRRAMMALVACPTASIGTEPHESAQEGVEAFPELIDDNVYFCGFTSEDSFGAWSWLVRRPEGNVLVDSPRAMEPLLKKIAAMGGVKRMILTHRDDVADHAKFRERFECERIIHSDDAELGTQDSERILTGGDPYSFDDFVIIPTPGHTRGHVVILYREKYLFTGDHLCWNPEAGRLHAFRDAMWHSWPAQIRSMERLLDYRVEWVLPGHGQLWRAPSAEAMRRELERVIAWMKIARKTS